MECASLFEQFVVVKFAIAQLLFFVCVAGCVWLWGCGVFCVWEGGCSDGK